MQQLEDDDELAYSAEEGLAQTHVQEGDGRPSWMRTLHNSASTWLQLLPKSLQVILECIHEPWTLSFMIPISSFVEFKVLRFFAVVIFEMEVFWVVTLFGLVVR
jgi:hypothetical protein